MNLKLTLLFLCITTITFLSCNKEEKNNAPDFVDITYTPRPDDQIVGQGDFKITDSARDVSGQAIVYKNSFQHVLRFQGFKITNGPKLKVYLSQAPDNTDAIIKLDDLIAASGNFNYVFSINTKLNAYKYVLVFSEENKSIYCFAEL